MTAVDEADFHETIERHKLPEFTRDASRLVGKLVVAILQDEQGAIDTTYIVVENGERQLVLPINATHEARTLDNDPPCMAEEMTWYLEHVATEEVAEAFRQRHLERCRAYGDAQNRKIYEALKKKYEGGDALAGD